MPCERICATIQKLHFPLGLEDPRLVVEWFLDKRREHRSISRVHALLSSGSTATLARFLPFPSAISSIERSLRIERGDCLSMSGSFGLEEAIARFGKTEIFNTDQGSQFTSFAFTNTLKDADIRISMDGPGRRMDNVFIERLRRSLKYECVFLNAFESGSEARTGIGCWIGYYNADRPHSIFGGRTPDEVYTTQANEKNWRRDRTQNPS
jgi:hypothetical protein